MNTLLDLPTLIFILLTLFVIYKLRSILGTVDEEEVSRPMRNMQFSAAPSAHKNSEWDESWASYFENAEALKPKILELMQKNPSFQIKDFLSGARSAYEMILIAFGKGDKQALRPYVTDEVYNNFCLVIDQRQSRQQNLDIKIVSETKVEISDVTFKNNDVHIKVYFHMSIVQILKNEKNEILNEPQEQNVETNDLWTFSKSVKDKNPNYILTATQIKYNA